MLKDSRHFLYGNTDESSCVPDAARSIDGCLPGSMAYHGQDGYAGPAFDTDGALVLGMSFGDTIAAPDALFELDESFEDAEPFEQDASSRVEALYEPDTLSEVDEPLFSGALCDVTFASEALTLDADAITGTSTALADLTGRYLVDALKPWDSYHDNWALESPLLLRFEDGDIVFSCDEEGQIRTWSGEMDTSRPIRMYPQGTPEADEANDRYCLQWAPLSLLGPAYGCEVLDAVDNSSNGIDIDLEDSYIHLYTIDGGVIPALHPR